MNDGPKDFDLNNTQGNQPGLAFGDAEPRSISDVFQYAHWHGGGADRWGGSFTVVKNIDPELWRDERFRQEHLRPADKRSWDKNVYCLRPTGEIYAVISFLGWRRRRRLGELWDCLAAFQASLDMYLEDDAVTEGLIYYLGAQWGKYIREDDTSIPCGWPDADERRLLGISGHGFKRNNSYIKLLKLPDVPIKGMSRNALEFHKSWIDLSERFRVGLWVHFVPLATRTEKAELLGLSLDAYQFLIEDAVSAMIRAMLSESQKSA